MVDNPIRMGTKQKTQKHEIVDGSVRRRAGSGLCVFVFVEGLK